MGLGAGAMMVTLLGWTVLLLLVQGDPWLASLLLLPMVSVLAWWARESSVHNI